MQDTRAFEQLEHPPGALSHLTFRCAQRMQEKLFCIGAPEELVVIESGLDEFEDKGIWEGIANDAGLLLWTGGSQMVDIKAQIAAAASGKSWNHHRSQGGM